MAPVRAVVYAAVVALVAALLPLGRAEAVPTQGIITTVAGTGSLGTSGDGAAATSAQIGARHVAVAPDGNPYAGDVFFTQDRTVRRFTPGGNIHLFAGGGSTFTEGGDALDVQLLGLTGIDVAADGTVYVAAGGYPGGLYRIDPAGRVYTVVAPGASGPDRDLWDQPEGIAVDPSGNVYVAVMANHKVYKVTAAGDISVFYGTGMLGCTPEGYRNEAGVWVITGFRAQKPIDVALSPDGGTVYVNDQTNSAIWAVPVADRFTRTMVSGTWDEATCKATPAGIDIPYPYGIDVDGSGALYVAGRGMSSNLSHRVYRIAGGSHEVVAGTGEDGFSGDGGPAVDAKTARPRFIAVSDDGTLFVRTTEGPYNEHMGTRIRMVTPVPSDRDGDGFDDRDDVCPDDAGGAGSADGCLPPPRTRYVALGDSFSSGEAAVTEGEDPSLSFIDNSWDAASTGGTNCHRSKWAYSQLLSQELGRPADFVACSGGVIHNVFHEKQYAGEDGLQIDHVKGDERVITISIGGNDLGFAGILTWCNVAKNCQNGVDGTYHEHQDTVDNNILAMYPRLYEVYSQLRERSNNAPIFVIGYPTIVSETPNDWFLHGFDQGEIDYMLPRFERFKDVMRKAAADAGVHFVDPDPYFDVDGGNHRYGDSDSWFADFKDIHEQATVGKFPFHPTRKGHAAMAQALMDAGAADPEHHPNPTPLTDGPDPSFETPDHWWAWDQDDLLNLFACASTPGCEPQIRPVPIDKGEVPNTPQSKTAGGQTVLASGYIRYGTPVPLGVRVDRQSKKFCPGERASGPFSDSTHEWYYCGAGLDGNGRAPSVHQWAQPNASNPPQPQVVNRGNPIQFRVNVLPNSVGNIQVHSTPRDLGTFTADAAGVMEGIVWLPEDLESGNHTLVFDGLAPDGSQLRLEAPLLVPAEPDDGDGGDGGDGGGDAGGGGGDAGDGGDSGGVTPTSATTGGHATATAAVQGTVTSPRGGAVSIVTAPADGTVPHGFRRLNAQLEISAPAATAAQPLALEFRLHQSLLGAGDDGAEVRVLRNHDLVDECAGSSVAAPDPCVSSVQMPGEEVVLTVLSSRASTWTFAVPVTADARACDGAPAAVFADVTADNVHGAAIDCVAWWNVAKGLSTTTYSPAARVTRGQMASFLVRLIEEAGATLPSGVHTFGDVDGTTHEAAIAKLSGARLVRGTTAATYEPDATVTRAQMATFLVRAYEYVADVALRADSDVFADDDGDAHERSINTAAGAGLVRGTTATTFAPGSSVRRDQMASFLRNVLERLVREGVTPPRL